MGQKIWNHNYEIRKNLKDLTNKNCKEKKTTKTTKKKKMTYYFYAQYCEINTDRCINCNEAVTEKF